MIKRLKKKENDGNTPEKNKSNKNIQKNTKNETENNQSTTPQVNKNNRRHRNKRSEKYETSDFITQDLNESLGDESNTPKSQFDSKETVQLFKSDYDNVLKEKNFETIKIGTVKVESNLFKASLNDFLINNKI